MTTANDINLNTITTEAFEAYRRRDWESLRASFEEAAEAASALWPGEEDYSRCKLQRIAGTCRAAARDAFTEPGDSIESDHQNRLVLKAMQGLHDLSSLFAERLISDLAHAFGGVSQIPPCGAS
jgi:hypothetical protein